MVCKNTGRLTAVGLVVLFLELLLDDTFHLKESGDLIGIEHCRQFVDILHPDALSPLLHLHLALSHGCGLGAGAGLDGTLAFGPQGFHLLAVTAIDGFKLLLLVSGYLQAVNEFTHLGLIQPLVD